jgi:hypothetical protein
LTQPRPETIERDILWGAPAIAKAIGKSPRATYHMLERGQLPATKIGGQWVMSMVKLLEVVRGGDE